MDAGEWAGQLDGHTVWRAELGEKKAPSFSRVESSPALTSDRSRPTQAWSDTRRVEQRPKQ